MKKLCDLFNRYRDGMLDPEQERQFASHLESCNQCRMHLLLLNNLVHAIRNQDIPDPANRSEMIADRAYEKTGSWDVFMLSWLKPLPVWSGLAVLLFFFVLFWTAPFAGQPTPGSDYEYLLTEGDQQGKAIENLSDAELESWLEQGGTI
jgi:hypothetical protein